MGFIYIKHPLHCCLAWRHLLPVFGIQQPRSLGILSRAFGGEPSSRPPTPQAHPSRRRSRLPLTWRPQLSSPEHPTLSNPQEAGSASQPQPLPLPDMPFCSVHPHLSQVEYRQEQSKALPLRDMSPISIHLTGTYLTLTACHSPQFEPGAKSIL